MEEISNVAKKYNLIILSDEIYSELTFAKNYKSISNFCPEKTIISTGLSKWCGAGGWRLGYFIIPEALNDIKKIIQSSRKILSDQGVLLMENGIDQSGKIRRLLQANDFTDISIHMDYNGHGRFTSSYKK